MTAIPTKMQTWGDDLRLPSLQPTETATLLAALEQDRRIAMPFQSKHLAALKRNIWFALKRPSDRSRTGLLVIWPEHKACVYVQGGPSGNPRVALLRLRVDSQFVSPAAGLTVFAATLSPAARRLWIEDVIQWKGARLQEQKSFTQRWSLVQQWLKHHYTPDPRMISGIEVGPAAWTSLASVRPDGSWDLQQDTAGQKRLYWLEEKGPATSAAAVAEPKKNIQWKGSPPPLLVQKHVGPLIAIAIKEAGPDQWSLAAVDGILLGRALIRRFQVSSDLRSAGGRPFVEVQWTPEFEKWEIIALSSANTATTGAIFAASK